MGFALTTSSLKRLPELREGKNSHRHLNPCKSDRQLLSFFTFPKSVWGRGKKEEKNNRKRRNSLQLAVVSLSAAVTSQGSWWETWPSVTPNEQPAACQGVGGVRGVSGVLGGGGRRPTALVMSCCCATGLSDEPWSRHHHRHCRRRRAYCTAGPVMQYPGRLLRGQGAPLAVTRAEATRRKGVLKPVWR